MKLIEEIKNCGIAPSDLTVNENFCLYESNVNEIHGLIGADYAGKLFTGEIKNMPSGLVAMNTYFGWTEPSISQSKSEIEEAVNEHFVRSLRRDDEDRYQVSLPWLRVHPELPDSRNIAEKRLKSCVRTLQKRNCLWECENIFKEWVSKKIIEPVEPDELAREKGHFLPHRPIFKKKTPPPESARFRQGKYGVISDIRRAFLQIKVAPSDRKFLRGWVSLWWEEGDPRKLIVYSHCRVVFGVNASPFLLFTTINYHLENVAESQKGIAAKLKESMYVDNCVASVNTIGELNSFIKVSKELMASVQFDLRGWKHNRPASNDENSILNLSSDEFREIVCLGT
ncbi:integrase catalytic domain-containing protein [Trichonephila clavipes]|nr:integrase catalytic domain-containing protein [Trichonephila clavipes]